MSSCEDLFELVLWGSPVQVRGVGGLFEKPGYWGKFRSYSLELRWGVPHEDSPKLLPSCRVHTQGNGLAMALNLQAHDR